MNKKISDLVAEFMEKTARNQISIEIKEKPVGDIRTSKLGGNPAVPEGFVWPRYTGTDDDEEECTDKPLTFLAQIDLSTIAEYDSEGLLPKSGMLSFFYELETMTWGYDPKDKGSARVYYFSDVEGLTEQECPDDLEQDFIIPECTLTFIKQKSYCNLIGDLPKECNEEKEIDDDDFEILLEKYSNDGYPMKLLGYPDIIQNPMEEECELCSRGYYMGGSYPELSEEESKDVKEKSRDWILLFQMNSLELEDYSLDFGDLGSIYFWIRKQDLREKNFDNIWLQLQCY